MLTESGLRKLPSAPWDNCRRFNDCYRIKSIMASDTKGCGDCTARAIMAVCATCKDLERKQNGQVQVV